MIEQKEYIRNQSELLFTKYGIRSVTMDDIAAQLGISKKTIYRIYKDKNALIEDVIECKVCANQESCTHTKIVSENAVHEGILMLDYIVEMLKSMNSGFLFDLKKYHPKAFTVFLRHKEEFMFKSVYEHLKRGIEEGLFREELNIPVIARMRVESVIMMFNPDVQESVACTVPEIQKETIIHYLYGVVNAKGYKLLTRYLKKSK
jgi:hypothetical protein